MQKRIVVLSMVAILGLVSYFTVRFMNSEATALNDSFTKEFIAEEFVDEDFHLFQSKTGQYRMLFPNEFQMVSEPPEFYGRQGDYYEHWAAQIFNEKSNGISYYFTVKFREDEVDFHKTRLNRMLEDNSYNGLFEELVTKDKIISHGSSFWDSNDPRGDKKDPNKYNANVFFGLIVDPDSNRSIVIDYSTICYKEELGCDLDSDAEYEFALKLMKSIDFLNP
ncbi:hypothetical protein RYX45_06615 [Alkalihalophilus pseudofirmus]|uniref:Uncharacterized protein n=1 Tax=Alkalihalophilus pseudofirmus TaxID=79885 RepID=A0AAJ2KUB6_ALKPS|nr:hypothetical protein [Alkalihalophilus pseudofirmus]MDV2884844.1 hypothetical protein [Alkalihalophilus pseudofirmus]